MEYKRINYSVIRRSFERDYVTVILGPRRVGKTHMSEHYAKSTLERKWVFLNMDKMQERERVKQQELSLMIAEGAKQAIGGKEKIWVLIDEAQKCPELFDQIKLLYDQYKDKSKIKFILTGSAILSLHRLTAESLAGRVELYHLNELTLREQALISEPTLSCTSLLDLIENQSIDKIKDYVSSLIPFRPILEQTLKKQLIWGGFPELVFLNENEEKAIYLNNYIETYLEKDIRPIGTIMDISLYKHLMDVIAEQTGSTRDDTKILQALHCKRETLKKYRGYLEATLLYIDIYPYIGSTLKRLVKSPKGYLVSNGLISVLTGLLDNAVLEKTGLIGHRVENWFLNEIKTWIARTTKRSNIYYWRTTSGNEVDFIVEQKPNIIPFEITYSNTINRKKYKNLIMFLKDEKKSTWGYFVYNGELKIDDKNRIICLPLWAIG